MSASSNAAGSLSFLMDIIPVIVIIILIIAFAVGRHKYHREKKELDKTIVECKKGNEKKYE